jgi:hypothetical protein
MRTLKEIKTENEKIATFTTTESYNNYSALYDADLVSDLEYADFGAILEYTLHRMKEEGFTDDDINYNSNMYIPSDEEWADLEEYEEYHHVDLGYIIGGLIMTINDEEENA